MAHAGHAFHHDVHGDRCPGARQGSVLPPAHEDSPLTVDPAPIAVILGLSPTGLYAARELGRAGIPLLGIDRETGCAGFSRFFESGRAWKCGGHEELLGRLLEFAGTAGSPPVLLPTNDAFVEFVVQRAAELGQAFRFAGAYLGAAADLLDKARFHALCLRHGLAAPGIWEIASRKDVDAIIDDIPYPCILKPVLIHRARPFLKGKKVLVVKGKDQLLGWIGEMPPGTGSWLVQEIVPGPESNITVFAGYMDRQGNPRQVFTARKLRQYPAGFGSASLVIGDECEETAAKSVGFLKSIGFRGVCGTEFKRDPRDGVLKVIEINPRPTLWFHLSHESGKRVVEAAFRDLAGLEMPADTPQANGVVWRYGLKDFASSVFYAKRGRDFVFPAPDVSACRRASRRCWPVFDARDPLPALFEPLTYVRKALARIR